MIIFDEIYRWKGPEDGCKGCMGYEAKEGLCLLTCHLCIIDLFSPTTPVMPMRRHVVIAEDLSQGPLRRICAESIGRHIFDRFHLEIKRTLWIECDPFLKEIFHVAQFTPTYHDGNETIYTINWRPLLVSEKIALEGHLGRKMAPSSLQQTSLNP